MTPGGLIFLIASWGTILGLLVFCLARTLRSEKEGDTVSSKKSDP